MGMSDCEKCWETPCVCGFCYKDYPDKKLVEMRDMFQGLLDGGNKYSRHSRANNGSNFNPEYLRRNLVHAKSVGVCANLKAALKRLRASKSPVKWLIDNLEGTLGRAKVVRNEIVKHRDEVEKIVI